MTSVRLRLQSWMRAHPLMLLALAAVAGIVLTDGGWLPWGTGPGCALLLAATMALLLGALTRRGARPWALACGAALVFAFIHHIRLEETFHHPLRQLLQRAAGMPETVHATLRGSLLPCYDIQAPGRAYALCTTQEITLAGSAAQPPITQPATLLVRLPPGARFPGPGVYELRGRLSPPLPALNPGAFDAREYSLRLGRIARFDADGLRRIGANHDGIWCAFLQAAERCRQWIGAQLTRDLEDDPETAAVIRAMALGVSAEADDAIEDAFRDSGTLHVFAVSGLHVALLGLITLTLLRQMRAPAAASLWLMIAVVFAYAFITGWRPSAARAAFMVAVFMGATGADRQSSLQNSLGLAALLLLATDTHQLFMPGFQLSFGVLWISSLGSTPLIERLRPLTGLDPFLPPQLADWRQRASAWCRRWLAATLSVSFAAWLGSLPFILMHFGTVTPVAVIANCVLVPLSFFCLAATCLSLCAALAHVSGAQLLFNNLNWLLARLMILSAGWFASLPGGNFHVGGGTASAHAPASWRMLRLPYGAAANHLRIGNSHWLLDTGDDSSFTRILRPALRASGVRSLDGIFLSHNDARHIGAVPQLAAFCGGMPPLYCSTQEPGPQDSRRSTLPQLLAAAPEATLRRLAPGRPFLLAENAPLRAEVEVLHPAATFRHGSGDERAMVLRLRLGPWRILWMSDAGWHTEKLLCATAAAADLRCDVLIRSQHAEDKSPTEEFLLKAAPRAILCGSDSRHVETRLPSSLVKFAQRQNIPLFDTWEDGSVELIFTPETLRIQASATPRHLDLAPAAPVE